MTRPDVERASGGGTMTLAFRVGAVTYDRGRIDVVAFDALGVLAHMLPRRAKVLQKGDRLRMADVEALCHWSGLTTTGTGTLPQAVYPATDTCSVTTPPSHPGGYHAGGVLLADGRVLLVLGVSGDLQDCRIWDPATDNYVPAPELSSQPPLG